METTVKEVKTKSRTPQEIAAIRNETWLNLKETAQYLNIPEDKVKELLDDGYFILSNATTAGAALIDIESINKYLRDNLRARPSDSKFAQDQRIRQELRERGESMKNNLQRQIQRNNDNTKALEQALKNHSIDRIINQDNLNSVNSELNALAAKLGL